MTALAKNATRPHKVHPRNVNIVPADAGKVFYVGAFICREAATALAIPATDTAGLVPLGVVVESMFPTDNDKALTAALDNTTGADGSIDSDGEGTRCVRYDQSGEYAFAITGATPKVGAAAYLHDDNLVGVTSTNLVKAGVFTRPGPNGTWFVDISRASDLVGVVPQSTLVDLGGTLGTANDTLVVMPTLADAPATADALRDDLHTNWKAALDNNFADVQTKVNAIISALEAAGILV